MKYGKWIAKIAVMVLIAISLFGYVTMLLWNWLVPDLFHGPVITYWQALGLLALVKIFFWGFGKSSHAASSHWKPYWKEKWNAMSPEDRERFKQKMKDKWCYREPNSSESDSGTSNV